MPSINKKSNKTLIRVVLGIVFGILLVWGINKIIELQKYETTDDAQIDTDINTVSSRVSGFVTKIYFKDNQQVKEHDTLIVFDNKDLQIKVDQALAALQNAGANKEVSRANTSVSEQSIISSGQHIEDLKIKETLAEKEFNRIKNLLVNDAATQQQFDKSQAELESLNNSIKIAETQMSEAEKRTSAVGESIKVSESVIKQRQRELEYAKLQLSYSYVLAPCSGIVSKRSVQVGQYIQISQPLCAIVSDDIWVVANFKETQLSKMQENQKVEIQVDAFDNESLNGHIESFSPTTGAKFSLLPPDNATGNYVKVVQRIPVKIALDTSSDLYKKIKPGMSAFVKVFVKES